MILKNKKISIFLLILILIPVALYFTCYMYFFIQPTIKYGGSLEDVSASGKKYILVQTVNGMTAPPYKRVDIDTVSDAYCYLQFTKSNEEEYIFHSDFNNGNYYSRIKTTLGIQSDLNTYVIYIDGYEVIFDEVFQQNFFLYKATDWDILTPIIRQSDFSFLYAPLKNHFLPNRLIRSDFY